MFSTIVVGTDGSDTAALAVGMATDLARQNGAELHLVNAYRPSSAGVAGGNAAASGSDPVYRAVSKSASESMLAEMAAQTEGLTVKVHSESGPPAEAIVRAAEQVGADLIVVGSKGMRGARRVIGSVPNSVAHNAPCNVLIAKTT